ncbi:MAG: hypothetical protein KJ952_07145, partial [Candidatus Omnitrophica bacterium]|nr:hypothetical protein [Candidatus Omnitrophota bacterium]
MIEKCSKNNDISLLHITAISAFVLFVSIVLIVLNILQTPFDFWNSAHLAWASSITYGYKLYYGPGEGPVLCTMYGPFLALAYLPAIIAKLPTIKIIIASFISTCFYFLPIFWLLWLLVDRGKSICRKATFIVFAFTLFCLFTLTHFGLSQSAFRLDADGPALGITALSCVFLCLYFRTKRNTTLFLSAMFSIVAFWTKMTMAPVIIALPVYIL